MDDTRVDPSDNFNYAIRKASENGHVEIVRLLLSGNTSLPLRLTTIDKRVNPGRNYNIAIRNASSNGHLKVVQELLKGS